MSKGDKELWLIDDPHAQGTNGRWSIYLPTPQGYKMACQINLWPQLGTATSPHVLPEKVRLFARLLDESLGSHTPDPAEGEIRYRANLRQDEQGLWIKVAYRPWAIIGPDYTPTNSRKTLEKDLLAWSKAGPDTAHLYAEIKYVYPQAAIELQYYYERKFRLSPKQAHIMANWALQIAYRDNYWFPHIRFGAKDRTLKNPWISPK
ncbi:hypothetical protein ACOSOMT5_P1152 [Acidiphilium sp. MT5]